MILILIGLRGSGKSTIGRALAQRLRVRFDDLDDLTPAVLGCATVAEAWERWGEPAFRAAEVRALSSSLPEAEGVLALGGGTPTAPGAGDVLRSARHAGGIVVYLRAQPEALRARLRGADLSQRPSLTGGDPVGEIETVFAVRDPLYRRLADRVVETDAMSVADVVEAVATLAGEMQG